MSYILAIDSSGPRFSLALERRSDNYRFSHIAPQARTHDERLAVAVAELLQSAGAAPAEISAVLLGAGPGSFTGLRIGYAFAKGLAFGVRCAIGSAGTFDAIAALHAGESGVCLVLSDARRGELFWCAYRAGSAISEVQIASPAKISEALGAMRMPGEPLAAYSYEELPAALAEHIGCIPQTELRVAEGLLLIGLMALQSNSGEALKQLVSASPHYLRKVSALTIEERKSCGLAK